VPRLASGVALRGSGVFSHQSTPLSFHLFLFTHNAGTPASLEEGLKTMSGYSDKKEPARPPIERVSEYKSEAPRAARFAQGARNIGEIDEACARRRAHNEALSKRDIGPRSSGNHDSK
jgi:hypothetical protein